MVDRFRPKVSRWPADKDFEDLKVAGVNKFRPFNLLLYNWMRWFLEFEERLQDKFGTIISRGPFLFSCIDGRFDDFSWSVWGFYKTPGRTINNSVSETRVIFCHQLWKCCQLHQVGVSKNNGTPKSSILIGCSIINHPFWGTPMFGNTQVDIRGHASWKARIVSGQIRSRPKTRPISLKVGSGLDPGCFREIRVGEIL